MASIPLSATDVRIMRNVRFANDYKHTRYFENRTDQYNYFAGLPTTWRTATSTFQRSHDGRTYVKASVQQESLWGSNYMMFRNTEYGDRWIYAFVTHLEYISDHTTKVYFEVDEFQTWFLDCNFYKSFVVREHCKLWNSDGSPVINTVPEDLNYGTEYDIVGANQYTYFSGIRWLIIVCKERMDEEADTDVKIDPSFNGLPSPLTYYALPFNVTGDEVSVNVGGVSFTAGNVLQVLKALYTKDKATNNIVSLYTQDYIGFPTSATATSITITPMTGYDIRKVTITSTEDVSGNPGFFCLRIGHVIRYTSTVEDTGIEKWTALKAGITESKLLMYPYSLSVLSDNRGSVLEVKNEYLGTNTYKLRLYGGIGTSSSLYQTLEKYNGDTAFGTLQSNMIDNNPNDIPVLTDQLSAYLQGNKNSLQNQKDQTIWNTTMGIFSNITGMAGSIATGNIIGAVSSGLNTVGGVGAGVLQMEAMNAKQRDIANVPPSMSKEGSNAAMFNGNHFNGVMVYHKQIKTEYKRKLESFFHAYGYAVKEVKQPNLHTRQHFNYVQTVEASIQGNIATESLQKLRSIFDNGICLWHTNDIGNYSLANGVI